MPIAEWANEWDLSRRSIGSLWSRDVAWPRLLGAAHKADVLGFRGLHGGAFRSHSSSCTASSGPRLICEGKGGSGFELQALSRD